MPKKKEIEISPVFKQQSENYTKIARYIQSLVPDWLRILDLERWCITFDYVPAFCKTLPTAGAQVFTSPDYYSATIEFYLAQLAGESERELEACLVHELIHIVLKQVETKKTRRRDLEQTVVSLTKSFMRAKYSKK